MANEKVLRRDFRETTLGASQAAGAGTTAITFATDPSLPTLASNEMVRLIVGSEVEYLTAYTAASLSGTVVRARENTVASLHASGSRVVVGPTKRDFAVGRIAAATLTAGDLTLNSQSWADLSTALDLTLGWCWEFDLVEIGIAARVVSGAAAQSRDLYLDAVTRAGGVNVNSVGLTPFGGTVVPAPTGVTADEGVAGWAAMTADNARIGGPVFYRLVAADIDGTFSTKIRFRYRTSGANDRTMKASTTAPLHVWVINHGQQESLTN